jgi:hypothetical protein
MLRQVKISEGRTIEGLVEIVIVLFCVIIGPYGFIALNALPGSAIV